MASVEMEQDATGETAQPLPSPSPPNPHPSVTTTPRFLVLIYLLLYHFVDKFQ